MARPLALLVALLGAAQPAAGATLRNVLMITVDGARHDRPPRARGQDGEATRPGDRAILRSLCCRRQHPRFYRSKHPRAQQMLLCTGA
jgi:hypothetical protein